MEGALRRLGSSPASGAAWLDDEGEDQVLVRVSRAVGLPTGVPDVFGLALRVPTADGQYGDLLFATTGLGRLTRYTLTPARSVRGRPLTTLLPYRTSAGPVLLSAVSPEERTWTLSWAVGSGPWHSFAHLMLLAPAGTGDTELSFDPVRNSPPGLNSYRWVTRLREPSYAGARRSRGPEPFS
jgi:hypothetical protein